MPSPTTDSQTGFLASTSVKAPVRAASDASILLSGLKTIDDIVLAIGDRVLVKDNDSPAENGVYIVATGSWTRASDFNGTGDVVKGTRVFVTDGTTNAGKEFYVSSENPISIGSTAITFVVAQTTGDNTVPEGRLVATAPGLTGGGDLGSDRTIALDFNGLSTFTAVGADVLAVYDVSAGDHRRGTVAEVVGAVAPTNARTISTQPGLTGGGSLSADRTISLDVGGLSAPAAVDTANDFVLFYDTSAGAHAKVTPNDLQGANVAALAGLSGASDKLPYFTGLGAMTTSTMTAFGRSIIDDADAATARATIGSPASTVTITGTGALTGGGDLTTNRAISISTNGVTNSLLSQVSTATLKGRATAGTGNLEDLTATQVTALLDAFTSSTKGLAPASGGGTTNFLRADGSWAAPAGGGSGTLTGLTDVNIVGATDGDVVTWDSGTSKWINQQPPGGGGGGGAPIGATYLVQSANVDLTAEKTVTDTTTVAWDFATAGQAKASVPNGAITYAKIQNVSAADILLGRSTAGPGSIEEVVCTAAGRALIDDASSGAQRATLGLVPGTDIMAFDAGLVSIAGLTTAADTMIYATASDVYATTSLTAAGRAILDDADSGAQRVTLGLGSLATLNAVNGSNWSGQDLAVADGGTGASTASGAFDNLAPTTTRGDLIFRGNATNQRLAAGSSGQIFVTQGNAADPVFKGVPWGVTVACSDETTAITAGTGKISFRLPRAVSLSGVRASLTTAQTSGSIFTIDINESGTTILSTKLTLDNTEKTSTTAATAAVISDTSLADDSEITIDVDQIGDGTAKGLKVTLIGTILA